ncbi:MAG: MBOAT family protein [Lachnospiraceae bacterium]|nr:MBOAT family protein [Lachnospiraceae bacterium]
MEFASTNFIWLFLPACLVLFYLAKWVLKDRVRDQICKFILLVASLFFYYMAGLKGLIILVIFILINYLGAIWLSGLGEKKNVAGKTAVFVILLILNAEWLAFYKYIGLFSGRSIIMPLAFSFVTFQSISYLVDVYKSKVAVEKNLLNYALFTTFFGQLSQGPILRYDDFGMQIAGKEGSFTDTIRVADFADGLRRFCYGLAKKVMIANTVAEACDKIWENPQGIGTPVAWFGLLLYTLQIYYDFSGYSDMAVGIGKMFGLKIRENFDYPYTSCSIQEFWRRWHMSLGSWFRDYIYIPLGGSRCSTARICFNLFVVFLVTGIWHGADVTFIIWGLIFALFSILERLFLRKWLDKNPVKILNWIYCTAVVMLGWVFFRAADLQQAFQYFRELFTFTTSAQHLTVIGYLNVDMILAIVAGILLCGFLQRLLNKVYLKIKGTVPFITVDLIVQIALLVWSVFMILQGSYTPAIYGRF